VTNNTTTAITAAAPTWPYTKSIPRWDIVDIANFARDRPQRRHTISLDTA
jgi:hypothetical protein